MNHNQRKTEIPGYLTGWKEIANYLGKGVRTVQRYEAELGLPVRRPAGKSCGSVVATKAELDGWVSASPIRQAFQLIRPPAELPAAVTEHIKSGIEEMRKLRDQMNGLRLEVRESVQALRDSIRGLHGELNLDELLENMERWQELPPPVIGRGHGTKPLFRLLATPGKDQSPS